MLGEAQECPYGTVQICDTNGCRCIRTANDPNMPEYIEPKSGL
jgi:hypothetical protein